MQDFPYFHVFEGRLNVCCVQRNQTVMTLEKQASFDTMQKRLLNFSLFTLLRRTHTLLKTSAPRKLLWKVCGYYVAIQTKVKASEYNIGCCIGYNSRKFETFGTNKVAFPYFCVRLKKVTQLLKRPFLSSDYAGPPSLPRACVGHSQGL